MSTNPLTLSGTNTYSGATTVLASTLTIGSNGSINATSGVVIGAGEFNYNSDTPLTQGITFSGTEGTLSGTGTIGIPVSVTSGNSHAPGGVGTVGNQHFSADLTYADGSIFEWDLNDNSTSMGFDMVGADGAISVDTTNTVFRVVFGENVEMTDGFWNTPNGTQTWLMTSIFGKNLSSGSFQRVETNYDVSQYGSFTMSDTSLVYTSFATIPEPSNVLVGLLVGAALVRRRR